MFAKKSKRARLIRALFIGFVFSFSAGLAPHSARYNAVVEHVIDGDTVILKGGEKVRLIGINAPEKSFNDRQPEPYSLEAKLALAELVEDKKVVVIPGQQSIDRYGRTLAYIQLASSGVDVQESLLLRGYAAAVGLPPNVKNIARYLQVEDIAKARQRGLWLTDLFQVDLNRHFDAGVPTGFKIVSGEISDYHESKRNKIFMFGKQLSVLISHENWKQYWHPQSAENMLGNQVEARGWVVERGGRKWLTVGHPAMMRQR